MNLKKLLTEERAVSPVIGVILMVAITVILAAVIGTFVLGLGDQVSQTSPTAQFTFEYDADADNLTAIHDGGDEIKAGTILFKGDVDTTTQYDSQLDTNGTYPTLTPVFTAGDSVLVHTLDQSSITVRIVWESADSSNSATIGKFES